MRALAAAMCTSALLALTGTAAWSAGYGDLSREHDGYAPPPHVTGGGTAPPGPGDSRGAVPPTGGDDRFAAEAARLRALAAEWEKAISSPAPEESFLVPDPVLLARMKEVAGDDDALLATLSGGFTLPELEALALLRSPAVTAKEHSLRAALDGYGQAENLDTILRRYGTFAAGLMPGVRPMASPGAMAAEPFPFPGILALKGQVVTQEAKAVREELEAARRDAVTSVRKGYWELLYLHAALAAMDLTHDLLENLKKTATARYSAGEASVQDVLRAAVALEKVKEEHLTMAGMARNAEGMIRETLALPPESAIGSPADATRGGGVPPLDALLATASRRRQEIRRMHAMVGKMERMVEMQETMVLPPFTLDLSPAAADLASRDGDAAGMGGEQSAGAGLPKNPLFGTNEAYLRELRQRLAAQREELRMEEAATAQAVRTARFRLDRAMREEALYRDRLSTLTRSALEAASKGYSAGKVTFSDVLEAYMGWFEANVGIAKGRSDAGTAWADLEAAVGTTLPPAGGGAK